MAYYEKKEVASWLLNNGDPETYGYIMTIPSDVIEPEGRAWLSEETLREIITDEEFEALAREVEGREFKRES